MVNPITMGKKYLIALPRALLGFALMVAKSTRVETGVAAGVED